MTASWRVARPLAYFQRRETAQGEKRLCCHATKKMFGTTVESEMRLLRAKGNAKYHDHV